MPPLHFCDIQEALLCCLHYSSTHIIHETQYQNRSKINRYEISFLTGRELLRSLETFVRRGNNPILVLWFFSWENHFVKSPHQIGCPSMLVNNQSQMREDGQHCFLSGGRGGRGVIRRGVRGLWCENRGCHPWSSYQMFCLVAARLTQRSCASAKLCKHWMPDD